MFAHAQEGDAALAQFARHVPERGGGVRIAHAVDLAAWRQVHADPARPPDRHAGIHRFQQQARAVLNRAAIGVGAQVGAVLQELVQQVAVGGVHFHAIETGLHRHPGAVAVGLDHARELSGFKRPRRHIGAQRAHVADVAFGGNGAGRHGQLAVQEHRVGDAAHVPQLRHDPAAGGMHGGRDLAPALDLLGRPQPRRVRVAHALRGNGRGLGQDQTGAGALRVVLDHQVVGHAARIGVHARQGRHDDAVGQRQVTDAQGFEKLAHAKSLAPVAGPVA
ncbi:hypothetical protein D9M68_566100 [compost metagenome]